MRTLRRSSTVETWNDVEVNALRADPAVVNNKGIYEYLLGGKTDPKLLNVRLFDERTKVAAHAQQTQKAEGAGVSNCPLCAIGENVNKSRIYKLDEMDADHVTALVERRGHRPQELPDAVRHPQPSQGQQVATPQSSVKMEADHITPWRSRGKTDAANCQMLCLEDNRAKGAV